MTAAELIEKLRRLDPETPITVQDSGCGCCQAPDAEGILVRDSVLGVVLLHPEEVRRLKMEGDVL